jgi:hypothetical protein
MENMASRALMKAAASRGSAALVNNGELIALNLSYDMTAFGPYGFVP